ncbi:MAG TPA: serine/threonine-protein kinase, partial [Gemmataceae bacterium]|nr:serine/threonine-protein kinase [Gemmataceae bacterium]
YVSQASETRTIPPRETASATGMTPDLPPGYEFLRELGRGGMGVVYQARDTKLNRIVALKMILAGSHAAPSEMQRFLKEAEAVAAMQHANIVQIFETGQHHGLPYFTLEFVDGGTLAALVREQPLPSSEAARMVEELAHGIAYAHGKGIVHRDLKPENVLLGKPTDGSPWAVPKITDFGLAKRIEANPAREGGGGSGLTHTGAVMGTPSYMAPEQAAAQKEIGPAADIYALGAILYRLVTGRPPFQAATPLDTIMQVLADEPVPPSRLMSKTPRDLETIILKCLHKEPAKRYSSAQDLGDDLQRFLNGEPILARPVGRIEKAAKWVRRNPVVTGLLAAVILSLTVGTTAFYLKYRDADAQRKRAVIGEKKAKEQEQLTNAALTEVESTLIEGLLRPIGETPVAGALEEESFRKLAELSSDRTRIRFLEKGLETPAGVKRMGFRSDFIIPAVVGLNREQKVRVESLLLQRIRDNQLPPAAREPYFQLALALPIDDAEFNRAAMDELMSAMERTKSTREMRPYQGLLRLLPRTDRTEANRRAAVAVSNLLALLFDTDQPVVLIPPEMVDCHRVLMNYLGAQESSASAKQLIALGQKNTKVAVGDILTLSVQTMDRLDLSYSQKFAKEILAVLIEKSAIGASGEISFFDPAAFSTRNDSRRWDAIISRLQPTDLVEMGRRIVESFKQGEIPAAQCRLCYLLNALLPGIDAAEGKQLARSAALVLAERLKLASEISLIQYLPAIEILEPSIGPDEALLLAESLLDAAPRIRATPLYASLFEPYLKNLIRKFDEKGVQRFRNKLASLLDPKRKLDDSDPLAVAKRELEVRAGIPDSRVFDDKTLRDWLEQGKKSLEVHMAIMARAENVNPDALVRAIAGTLGQERDHQRLVMLAEMLAGLCKETPSTPWPAGVDPPHRLALLMIKNGANGIEFHALTHALAASANAMDVDEAKTTLGFLKSIVSQSGLLLKSVKPAADVLKAISTKLPEGEWESVAESLARTASSAFKLGFWFDDPCIAMENVLGILDAGRARKFARLAIQEWRGHDSNEKLTADQRQTALRPLLNRLTMEDIVALWKEPMCHPEKRDLLLNRLGQLVGRQFATIWDFVAWAEVNRPDLDLKSPYKPFPKEE